MKCNGDNDDDVSAISGSNLSGRTAGADTILKLIENSDGDDENDSYQQLLEKSRVGNHLNMSTNRVQINIFHLLKDRMKFKKEEFRSREDFPYLTSVAMKQQCDVIKSIMTLINNTINVDGNLHQKIEITQVNIHNLNLQFNVNVFPMTSPFFKSGAPPRPPTSNTNGYHTGDPSTSLGDETSDETPPSGNVENETFEERNDGPPVIPVSDHPSFHDSRIGSPVIPVSDHPSFHDSRIGSPVTLAPHIQDVPAADGSDVPDRTINDDQISIRRQSSDTMDNAFVNPPSVDMSSSFDPTSMTPVRSRFVANDRLSQLLERNAATAPQDNARIGSASPIIAGNERSESSSSEMRRKRPRMEDTGSEGSTDVSSNPFDMSRWSCMRRMLDPISYMMVNIELRDEDDTSFLESEARRIGATIQNIRTYRMPCGEGRYFQTFSAHEENSEKIKSAIVSENWMAQWKINNLMATDCQPFFFYAMGCGNLFKLVTYCTKFTGSRELYTTVRDKLDVQGTLRKFLSCPLFVNDFKQYLNHIGEAWWTEIVKKHDEREARGNGVPIRPRIRPRRR
ncbi:hypothetical protein CRE_15049 [Caenorhabditis remanei]|uniref:Uncharacterized protein n=1 Tax=Caenorhabditis remanei TaxID=31234 RepID=E3NL86_CAERE|nr:hypothetical protein CRE_15049 [Caenorhabditis remanei]